MKLLKYTGILILTVCVFVQCGNAPEKEITIVPFEILNSEHISVDRGERLYFKNDFFLVKSYVAGKKSEDFIEEFVKANQDSSRQQYTQYTMIFYKESSITNIEHISKNPRDIYRYSMNHDLIFTFIWNDGEFLSRHKYINGKTITPVKIIIKDIPESMK